MMFLVWGGNLAPFLLLNDSGQGVVVACTSFLISMGVWGEDCFKNNGKTATDRHT